MNMRLAIGVLVKDGASYVEKNIITFRDICSKCASVVDFYITENDSVDGTRDILQNMMDNGHLKLIDSITLDGKHSIDLCGAGELYNCDARVNRLAMLRQRVLRNVLSSGVSYDYFCVLDIDFIAIDAAELVSVFEYMQNNPSVDGMFGMSVHETNLECVYDLSAMGFWNTMHLYIPFSRYVRVTTGFGGVGVYRTSSISQDATYTTNDWKRIDDITGKHLHKLFSSNEHSVFNINFEHLLIDTQFRPVYSGTCTHPMLFNMPRWRMCIAVIFAILIAIIVWASARFVQTMS
jgi:hypothetical protein